MSLGSSIPIQNSDFETPALNLWGNANAPSWSNGFLHNIDSPTAFTSWPAAGHQTGYSRGDASTPPLVQTLAATLEPDLTYTLSVDVGRRLDQPFQFYEIRLNVVEGSESFQLARVDSATGPEPPAGGFATATLSFTAGVGDAHLGKPLQIWLASYGSRAGLRQSSILPGEVNFDNVRLSTSAGTPIAPPSVIDMHSDQWTGADALGRILPLRTSTGPLKPRRFVGITYGIGHLNLNYGPWDTNRAENNVPFPSECYPNPGCPDPPWCGRAMPCSVGQFHWMAEPELGYYVDIDPYVVRKHAQMFVAAGVDFVALGFTNGFAYWPQFFELVDIYRDMRSKGFQTPLIVPWAADNVMDDGTTETLWNKVYKTHCCDDVLFYWKDYDERTTPPTEASKPLVLYSESEIDENPFQRWPNLSQSLTMRQDWSDAWGIETSPAPPTWYDDANGAHSRGRYKWPFESRCLVSGCAEPTRYGWAKNINDKEMYPVSVAFHPIYEPMGRSFTRAGGQPVGLPGPLTDLGLNFQEQWDYALQHLTDTSRDQVALVMNWNQWLNFRFSKRYPYDCNFKQCVPADPPCGTPFAYDSPQFGTGYNCAPDSTVCGNGLNDEETYFIDETNREFSWDAEPIKGYHTDDYYYQLFENIRRFKGVRPLPKQPLQSGIAIDGDFTDWTGNSAIFKWPDFQDDGARQVGAQGQNHCFYGARNQADDIVAVAAAASSSDLYFYAKTKNPTRLQAIFDMVLLLDIDLNRKTGWQGYDFKVQPASTFRGVFRWDPSIGLSGNWREQAAGLDVAVNGNEMELRLPRSLLGIDPNVVGIDYHFADGLDGNDEFEFLAQTDSAPDRRANFRLIEPGKAPIADFTGSPRAGGAPLTVAFKDRSVGHRTSWTWDFGDGTPVVKGTTQNPIHIYQSPGIYTVKLTVENGYGSDTVLKANYIFACAAGVTVDFSAAPRRGPAPLKVAFDFPLSTGSYTWNFGDGFGSTEQRPFHSYTTEGVYDVTLAYSGGGGCQGATVTHRGYIEVTGDLPPLLVTGPGANPANAPNARGWTIDCLALPCSITPSSTDVLAYAAPGYGVNVAQLEMRPFHRGDILTGPGPGAVYGPEVKGFKPDGSPIGKVNFYAYATLRYGVNVAGGDVDGDTLDEILTGAGPGEVFGPHVRAFNFDGVKLTPIRKISFFPYQSLAYGVNVTTSALDQPTSARDRIVTGPGPGPKFAPNIHAYRFDASLSTIAKINIDAFPGKPRFYGVNVAGGNLDDVGGDDIVAGMPPGPITAIYTSQVAGFGIDFRQSPAVTRLKGDSTTDPVFRTSYGINVGTGAYLPSLPFQVQVLAGQGPDPTAETFVKGISTDTTTTPPTLRALPGFTFNAYGPERYRYGAKVGGSREPPIPDVASGIEPTDALMRVARQLTAATPISTTLCDSCDPAQNLPAGSAWGDDASYQQALDAWDALLATLPDLVDPSQVIARLDAIMALASDPVKGITNALALAELGKQMALIRGYYDPPAFPSTAVTALFPGFDEPNSMALSEPTGKLFVRPSFSARNIVHQFDTEQLVKEPDRSLPSSVASNHTTMPWALARPMGRSEVYVATTHDRWPYSSVYYAIERLDPDGAVRQDPAYIDIFSTPEFVAPSAPTAIAVTPSNGTALKPDSAYIAYEKDPSNIRPALVAVEGLRDFRTAQVVTLAKGLAAPVYRALALSSATGSDLVYAAHLKGIDRVHTTTHVIDSQAIVFPPGFGEPVAMDAGVTALGSSILAVASADRLLVYDLPSETLVGDVALAGDARSVHLSLDGRYLLVVRHQQAVPLESLLVLDADTRLLVRESTMAQCPGGTPCGLSRYVNPMALTIDSAHAVVTAPDANRLDLVYLQPSRLVVPAACLVRFAAAIPSTAFAKPQDQQKLVKAFTKVTKELDKAAAFQAMWTENPVLQAELEREAAFKGSRLRSGAALDAGNSGDRSRESGDDGEDDDDDGDERQEHLREALEKLYKAMDLFDGCTGGDPKHDVITDCDEARTLMHAARQLEQSIEGQLAPEPPKVMP